MDKLACGADCEGARGENGVEEEPVSGEDDGTKDQGRIHLVNLMRSLVCIAVGYIECSCL